MFCAWLALASLAAADSPVPMGSATPPNPAQAQADSPDPKGPAAHADLADADDDARLRPSVVASGDDGVSHDALTTNDWQRDDWMLVRPKVALLELGGYFRARTFRLNRLDFGVGTQTEIDTGGAAQARYPAIAGGANFSSTTMRLRLEPRINVNERAQITATFDLLDNLVLGSTPDTQLMRTRGRLPPDLVSGSQTVARRGVNSFSDSVVVKRLWARVSAFNEQVELRIGRMPDHFGLGMMYNNGDGLDADYGTVADRIALQIRLFDHLFVPMVDWVGRGPGLRPFGASDPASIDATGVDDAIGLGFRILRHDHADDIRDAVAHGRSIINYGTSHTFRTQSQAFTPTDLADLRPASDLATATLDGAAASPTAQNTLEQRDAFLYVGDLYAMWARGPWELKAEVALHSGHFSDSQSFADNSLQRVGILRGGGAFEGRWRHRPDGRGLQLGLRAGGASGDGHAGMGALDYADTQRGPGDLRLHNFQFSPDYHVDLLLFRRIIGTVTDALYLRPEVAYRFDEQVLGRVNLVYSQAVDKASTPSAEGSAPGRPLGLEIDAELLIGPPIELPQGAVLASVQAGMLFPLKGFELPEIGRSTGFAWTLQGRLWLTF